MPKSREFVKDKYREIKKFNCGEMTAKMIRSIDPQSKLQYTYVKHESSSVGSPKRPHVRRGHWHHYWAGKKDDRQVILKWQPPTFVHGKEAEEMLKNLENEQSDNEKE